MNTNAAVWRPSTRWGWWAVRLAALFVLLFVINSAVFMPLGQNPANERWMHMYLPYYGIAMILCGLTAGVIGLFAVIRKHEHSWLVWLTILPGAFVLFLVLGEFLVQH